MYVGRQSDKILDRYTRFKMFTSYRSVRLYPRVINKIKSKI